MRPLISFALFLASPAALAGSKVGAQASINVTGKKQLSDATDLGVAGILFLTPKNDPMYFHYLGPGVLVTSRWWVSPRVGLVLNWNDPDGSTPMGSLWQFVSVAGGKLTFFVETTVIHVNDHADYLGVYQADMRADWMNVGAHLEQVNDGITVGPHAGVKLSEHLSTSVQYHLDMNGGHAVRAVLSTKLN